MSIWFPRSSSSLLVRSYSTVIRVHPNPLRPLPVFARSQALVPASSRRFASSVPPDDRPKSSIDSAASTSETKPAVKDAVQAPLGTRIWKKVKHEAQHYWHGSKLLVSEVRISARLQWKILHGETLTRRERRQVRITLLVP